MDLQPTIVAKSDQINADDLLAGPRVYTVSRVSANDGGDATQPINIHFTESKVPWRPCKTMRRVLVALWGSDGEAYAGRSLKLWRDPEVVFGGIKVGGIRIAAMSHIDAPQMLMLSERRGKKAPVKVEPLGNETGAPVSSTITAEQADWLDTVMAEVGANKARFCHYFGISALSELPAARHDEAKRMLEAKRK